MPGFRPVMKTHARVGFLGGHSRYAREMPATRFVQLSLGALLALTLAACASGRRGSFPATDTGLADSGSSDSGSGDGSTPDSGTPDSGALDTGPDAPSCTAPVIDCGGTCVDPQTDAMNCGACGTTCTAAQECLVGTCTARCTTPTPDRCDTTCVDLTSDSAHCGACGTACTGTEICNASMCEIPCPTGETACSGACVDLMADESNCGACGNPCSTGERCSAGTCMMTSVDSVLIYYDSFTTGEIPAQLAATRMGATRVIAEAGEAAFNSQYDGDTWDVVVVSVAGGAIPAGVRTRVLSRITAGEPLIFSWWDLDSDAALQTALGVTVVSYSSPRPLHPATGAPVNLFSSVETFPVPLTNSHDAGDNGDLLTPTGTASVLVRQDSPTGGNVAVLTNGGTTLVNGFLPWDYRGTDNDMDSVPDMVEMMVNELSYF